MKLSFKLKKAPPKFKYVMGERGFNSQGSECLAFAAACTSGVECQGSKLPGALNGWNVLGFQVVAL